MHRNQHGALRRNYFVSDKLDSLPEILRRPSEVERIRRNVGGYVARHLTPDKRIVDECAADSNLCYGENP